MNNTSVKRSLDIRNNGRVNHLNTFYSGITCETPTMEKVLSSTIVVFAESSFGNNTSYYTHKATGEAYPFHIASDGALYIGFAHESSSLSPLLPISSLNELLNGGVELDSNSVVEDIFSDFINDPTIGSRYTPVLSHLADIYHRKNFFGFPYLPHSP